MAEDKEHQPFGEKPEEHGFSDQLIVVPTNPTQVASWYDTVHFYARLINLTSQEIKTGGIGGGISYVKHGKFIDLKSAFPSTAPPNSVSEPYHVLTVELNPDNFAKMEFELYASVQLSYIGTSGQLFFGQPVFWKVHVRSSWVKKGS